LTVPLQSLYYLFVADRTGDSPEPSWIEPMQARYVVARDGTIAYVDINADYRVAPESNSAEEIITSSGSGSMNVGAGSPTPSGRIIGASPGAGVSV
jgi:hypothetical protein